MNRRGSEEISWEFLLESVVVFVLIVLAIVFAFRISQIFYGADTTAVKVYELMGDNINSLIQNPEMGRDFRFRFNVVINTLQVDLSEEKHAVDYDIFIQRENYKGTIFAIDTDGRISYPFPAWVVNDNADQKQIDPNLLKPTIYPLDVSEECYGRPCLCFSKEILKWGMDASQQRALLTNPHSCRGFDQPSMVNRVEFNFKQLSIEINKESYPFILTNTKDFSNGLLKIDVRLFAQSAG